MIERITLKIQVYNYLKKEIIEGKLQTDKIYTEQGFADELNISRTPVREAVLQLAHEDFVVIKPNKGFMIKEYSDKDIEEYVQVRTAIEGFCAMYAASTKGTDKWKELICLLEDIVALENDMNSIESFINNDFNFHYSIVKYSGNSQMMSIFSDMRNRVDRISVKTFDRGGSTSNAHSEHIRLLDAIKEGNRSKAYDALDTHMNKYVDILLKK